MSGSFLREFYWALLRKPPAGQSVSRHVLGVLPRALATIARLRLRSGAPRPTVAIALMEHMGDVVAVEPIARLARRRFPEARIIWVTRPLFADIPASFPEIDEVVTSGCLTEWLLLRRLVRFDVVWDLHVSGRACPWCRVPLLKPGVAVTQSNYYNHGNLLEVACLAAGLPRLEDGPVLRPPAAAATAIDALGLPPRTIVMHCTSNVPARDWPAERWQELAACLLAAEPAVCLIEVGLRPLLVGQDGPRRRQLCGRLGLLETAEAIRRASLFIGIDSGPAHLANAVGTPGVILLGAYAGFHHQMPYSGSYANGRMADIIRAADAPVTAIPVAAVFAAAMARLAISEHPAS